MVYHSFSHDKNHNMLNYFSSGFLTLGKKCSMSIAANINILTGSLYLENIVDGLSKKYTIMQL